MEAVYQILTEGQIDRKLFSHFSRRQVVKRCWRKEDGEWKLKDIPFVDDWNEEDYGFLVKCLRNTIDTGGFVFGVFYGGALIGFASVESRLFGSSRQYVQLSCIHVSSEYRGKGIGRKLVQCAVMAGRKLGARKLYISAHSAEETQAFYHGMGCVEAREYDKGLSEAEPCDCQMEYPLLASQSQKEMNL